jgi:glycosyltransferase involved in cell wall biosynthesis
MKFSVLLPTRNRLDLLSYAIETVRRQDYPDWEIIVSDNCSDEDISGYVRCLSDDRIKYVRIPQPIPVTDNWNNALDLSQGDYIIMLGDDDGLMRGYFSMLKHVIEEHDSPDFIYTSALLYAYPSVMPGYPDGYLRTYTSKKIYRAACEPFRLTKKEATMLVEHSLNFRMHFDYNMQFFFVSRKLVNQLKQYGPFYQSPYPDYYASNAMMLKADHIVVVPKPLVAIGISPKSFGFYYFNDSENTGNAFLQNADSDLDAQVRRILLPGTDMNTSWLLAMEKLVTNFGEEFPIRVNTHRYRFLQICATYAKVIRNTSQASLLPKDINGKLTPLEYWVYAFPLSVLTKFSSLTPQRIRQLIARVPLSAARSHPGGVLPMVEGKYKTILDVFVHAPSQ